MRAKLNALHPQYKHKTSNTCMVAFNLISCQAHRVRQKRNIC